MDQILLFVATGLSPGALIAGVAIGVVLAYRGAGVINMATGAVALVGAYTYYGLRAGGYIFVSAVSLGGPWPLWPALLGALAVSALTGVLLELLVLRPLRAHSPLTKLLATLGVFLTIQAVTTLCFGTDGQQPASVLPSAPGDTVRIFGVPLPDQGFEITGIVIVAAAALAVVYRLTRFGLATRAAAEDETKAALAGLSPNALSMANVVLASLLAGTLGVLVSPSTGLDPVTIPDTIVPALAAALLARFTSFGIAVAAGIGMGVIESLVTYLQAQSWFPTSAGQTIPGVPDLLFFLIVVAAMFWRGASLPQRGHLAEKRLPAAPAAKRMTRPAVTGAAACAIAFLVLPYDIRQAEINSLIGVIECLALVVIIGFVGQASLAQVALSGVAGFTISKLAASAGIGFPWSLLAGVVAAVVLGLAIAASALRVRGVNLAIVTLTAAVALESFGFDNPAWGGGAAGSPVPPPHLFGLDIGNDAPFFVGGGSLPSPLFGLVCTAFAVALCLLVASVRRSDLGHRMLAVRSNERAAAAAGINVRQVKLVAFGLSSAIAGIAGGLYAYNFGSVSAERFGLATALTVVAFAYVGGITTVTGAALAGLGVTGGLLGHLIIDKIGIPGDYQLLVGGIAMVATIVFKPGGLAASGGAIPSPAALGRRIRGGRAGGAPPAPGGTVPDGHGAHATTGEPTVQVAP